MMPLKAAGAAVDVAVAPTGDVAVAALSAGSVLLPQPIAVETMAAKMAPLHARRWIVICILLLMRTIDAGRTKDDGVAGAGLRCAHMSSALARPLLAALVSVTFKMGWRVIRFGEGM